MSFFEEKEFETKDIDGKIKKDVYVLYHDSRTGFVGIASDDHKKNNPEEYQKFLAEKDGPDAKPAEDEVASAGPEDEAFEDKNASVPVDGDTDSEPMPGSDEDVSSH